MNHWFPQRAADIRLWFAAVMVIFAGCASEQKRQDIAHGDGIADFDGGVLRYDDLGDPQKADAPPIVLIHGWASGREFWHKQTDALTESRRVIAIDLPGHGQSDEPATPHSMKLYADAIAAVLDDASVERAVLVGHSNGTPTVRQFYRRYPERTAGLVAVDGALLRVFSDEMAAPMLAAFKGDDHAETAERLFAPMSAMMSDPADAQMVADRLGTTPQRTLIGGMEASLDDAVWINDRIAVPLLVINAPNPMIWTPAYVNDVRALSDDVEYLELEGVSHFLMMDDPESFNATLTAWLERHGW